MKRTGELLKKAREEKRLSLHEVALFLKINSRVLQAIEDGDQTHLPARTFLRGFIQSYAKFLKLDANNVLQIFSEENAPPVTQVSVATDPTVSSPERAEETTQASEIRQAAEQKAEIDVISLEKSILSKSQVAQDKLGFKTIAVSVVGLLLVVVLYFANSVVKKYQKEAQVDPVDSIASSENQDLTAEPVEEVGAPVTSTPVPMPTTTSTPPAAPAPTATAPSPARPVVATPAPSANAAANSVQNHQGNVLGTGLISPVTLPSPMIDTKAKLVEKAETKPVEKVAPAKTNAPPAPAIPVTTAPKIEKPVTATPKPVDKPVAAAAAANTATATLPATKPVTAASTDKPIDPKSEGKLVEVIVEANDAVEIEYSSSKTSPQKMVLKAEQIHTFKSRSGVRLKISNGGAVNIIMNGRDLGVPGAAGQPIQVTY